MTDTTKQKRGFQLVSTESDETLLPQRATEFSAGYDFRAAETVSVSPHNIILVKTGVKAFMQSDEVLKLYDRSSNPRKQGFVLANSVGIIDADYYNNSDNEGHIMVQVLNISDHDITIRRGDRIAQGIFQTYLTTSDDVPTSKKRKGGFGSTGTH